MSHEKASEVAKRYQLSTYDASIVTSAVISGALVLLSEDTHNGLRSDGLVIENPFKEKFI
ncbi:MAG: hypothetical protein IPN53_07710 [Comamonadaceae bacterium]|nr:hypothetical protein [Comamonadaceae bacterium]